jgi:glutathione S-transferase
MIRLHGMPRSNYYSLVKAALLEKSLPFEEVAAPPSQEEAYLTKSPMGKVPCLETEQGFLSESLAILDYLENIQPEPALLPRDPFQRAKVIELIRHLELDVELVARRCLPAAFFGATASEETRTSTQRDLERGMKAVSRLLECNPYAAGPEFSAADLYVFYTFTLASAIVKTVFGTDLLERHAAIRDLLDVLAERASIHQVEAAKSA